MTDPAPGFAAVKFDFGDKLYDFVAPFPVAPGDRVIVETFKGDAEVTVDHLKTSSDKATKSILRFADAQPHSGDPF